MVKEVKGVLRIKKYKISMFDFVVVALLMVILIVVVYPLIYVVSASVSDPTAVSNGKMWLFPVNFTLEGYLRTIQYKSIWVGYGNTIFYTVTGTLLALVVTLPAAYAMSRPEFYGRGALTVMVMITMFFSGGLIPTYLNIQRLGLLDTRLLLIINGASSAYNLIVARTFFAGLPSSLIEAARIDGASNTKIFSKIILPLSKPIIAVMALYFAVPHWNEYFTPMIYIQSRDKYPLQVFLREILIQNQLDASMALDNDVAALAEQKGRIAHLVKYSSIVISSLPLISVYPFLQRYFIKGVMIGAVKE